MVNSTTTPFSMIEELLQGTSLSGRLFHSGTKTALEWCMHTLLVRFSFLFFFCLVAGERSKFLMRLLIVNPSLGILFWALWHFSENCWPSTVTKPPAGRVCACRLKSWMSACNDPPTTKPPPETNYRALQSRTVFLLPGHVDTNLLSGFAVLFCRSTSSTVSAVSLHCWTDDYQRCILHWQAKKAQLFAPVCLYDITSLIWTCIGLMITSMIAFVVVVPNWFNRISERP